MAKSITWLLWIRITSFTQSCIGSYSFVYDYIHFGDVKQAVIRVTGVCDSGLQRQLRRNRSPLESKLVITMSLRLLKTGSNFWALDITGSEEYIGALSEDCVTY